MGVLDLSLPAVWTTDPTGVLLRWSDTIQASTDQALIPIRLPRVDGAQPPPPPEMGLRHAAGHSADQSGWVAGEDVDLFLSPAPIEADPPQTLWRLEVATRTSQGIRVLLFASSIAGELPDTVVVPHAWLTEAGGGQLEATIDLHRTYLSTGPAGTYDVTATLRQRFRWSISVGQAASPGV